MTALLVALGAAVGAPVRYLADRWAKEHLPHGVVWGTLAVNVIGSLVLGYVAAASRLGSLPGWVLPAVGVGFCGALTTFSTLAYETWAMLDGRRVRWAATNILLSLVLGVIAVVVGWQLGLD